VAHNASHHRANSEAQLSLKQSQQRFAYVGRIVTSIVVASYGCMRLQGSTSALPVETTPANGEGRAPAEGAGTVDRRRRDASCSSFGVSYGFRDSGQRESLVTRVVCLLRRLDSCIRFCMPPSPRKNGQYTVLSQDITL
jgi:hypothetical protein